MIPSMDRSVFLVYLTPTGWVVRRADAGHETGVRFASSEAALLRARELADGCRPSRIEVSTDKGIVSLNYDM